MSQMARTSSSLPRWVTIACMLAWRSSWPSPNGVKGLRMLLEPTEQTTPCSRRRLRSTTLRGTLWSAWPPGPGGAPTPPGVPLGQIAAERGVELLGRGAGVERHVDVDVEFARHLEDAMDLRGPVGVVVGRGADHRGARLERGDHQRVGAGIVQKALLRHDADLEVDRPAVALDQRLDAL